jgi:hypothetical protein
MWIGVYENRTGPKTMELVGQPQFKYKISMFLDNLQTKQKQKWVQK